MRELKDIIRKRHHIPDELFDMFIARTKTICLKQGELLIAYGQLNSNVYIVKSGIIRYVYFDGTKEKTNGFVTTGMMIRSMYSYYRHSPSFTQFEACCDAEVLEISKKEFEKLVDESHDFAKWMLDFNYAQMWFYEQKLFVISGTAKERFESLIKNKPEILQKVSQKIIASYLDVTPEYLSSLKRKIFSLPKK